MSRKTFLAVDLGAGSGRVIAATFEEFRLSLHEVHRFENPGIDIPGGSFWNLIGLYHEIVDGLHKAVELYGNTIVSIGIDTWGCDYGLLAADGRLTGLIHQYRDSRHEGMTEAMHQAMSEEQIYAHTGIKTNFYNSSLHLMAESRSAHPAMEHSASLLFVPDILGYWLTGRKAVERTVASTSQLLDPRSGDWSWEVIEALGLPKHLFGEIMSPGTVLGTLSDEVAKHIGMSGIPVVATASHDTAAAVAGIPMEDSDNLWLSSGTWSIIGIETADPVTSPQALHGGFSNELGVANTVRFLKNISGLWLLQECRRQWEFDGDPLQFSTMAKLAEEAEPFSAFIDPDDPVFATAGEMPAKIAAWCEKTGQSVPKNRGAVLRVATESLALKYRTVYEGICQLTDRKFTTLHAGGGGIQNRALCQATANALGIKVVAGPVEATSCGNVITQMQAVGELENLHQGRELIRSSFEFDTYEPQDTAAWDEAYLRFQALLG